VPVGLAAIIFSALYVISDLMELANGGLFTAHSATGRWPDRG
jgi:hypothetical protein